MSYKIGGNGGGNWNPNLINEMKKEKNELYLQCRAMQRECDKMKR